MALLFRSIRVFPFQYCSGIFSGAFRQLKAMHCARVITSMKKVAGTLGANFKPIKTISLSGYFDMFSFPWLRYQVYAPSNGYEYLWQLTFTPSKKLEMYFRHKQTVKPQNTDVISDIDYLVDVNQSASRFNISYKVSTLLSHPEQPHRFYENKTRRC